MSAGDTNRSDKGTSLRRRTFPELPGLYYMEDFIDGGTEQELLACAGRNNWRVLRGRRVQNWGGLPHIRGMFAVELPNFLDFCVKELVSVGIFGEEAPPNHVLINDYAAGQGIDAHEDGPAYEACAAILSLQSALVMDFSDVDVQCAEMDGKSNERQRVGSLLLKRRSVVVLVGYAYTRLWHGIAPRTEDVVDELVLNRGELRVGSVLKREHRMSLTFRRSIKVLKNPVRLSRTSR